MARPTAEDFARVREEYRARMRQRRAELQGKTAGVKRKTPANKKRTPVKKTTVEQEEPQVAFGPEPVEPDTDAGPTEA